MIADVDTHAAQPPYAEHRLEETAALQSRLAVDELFWCFQSSAKSRSLSSSPRESQDNPHTALLNSSLELSFEEGQAPTATPPSSRAAKAASPRDAGTVANQTRLELLARRYAKKALTDEEAARLEIAKERVARLFPRVSAEHFEALAKSAELARDIERRLAARRADRDQ